MYSIDIPLSSSYSESVKYHSQLERNWAGRGQVVVGAYTHYLNSVLSFKVQEERSLIVVLLSNDTLILHNVVDLAEVCTFHGVRHLPLVELYDVIHNHVCRLSISKSAMTSLCSGAIPSMSSKFGDSVIIHDCTRFEHLALCLFPSLSSRKRASDLILSSSPMDHFVVANRFPVRLGCVVISWPSWIGVHRFHGAL